MGFDEAFSFNSVADVFREHAALSTFENDGARDFDLGGLAKLSDREYDDMAPALWPIRAGETEGRARFFGDGGFFTQDGRARFYAPETPALKTKTSQRYPLRLNTGRIRDQWHTMTRSGMSPRLAQHLPEPFVEIHPDDAAAYEIEDGGFARVSSAYGECVLKAVVTDRQPRGQLFAPIHWSDETASSARVGALVAPYTDPASGQPEAKATPVAIAAHAFALRGFAVARDALRMPAEAWWARVAVAGGVGYKIATNSNAANWRSRFAAQHDLVEYFDEALCVYRAAVFFEGRLERCIFIGPTEPAGAFDAVKAVLCKGEVTADQRKLLLGGVTSDGAAENGPIVCACFGVGATAIEAAIARGECVDIAGIGERLKAGTNCGSCVPELKRLLAAASAGAADGAKCCDSGAKIAARAI
jgi:assimilatory nitrate reductase catalytic subunit